MKTVLVLIFMGLSNICMATQTLEENLGKEAKFTLIKEKSRTNYMIKSGKSLLKVADIKRMEDGIEYQVNWKYDVLVKWAGKRAGTIKLMMPGEVFSDSFWSNLQDGAIRTSNLTMTYIANKSSVTVNNKTYEDCNIIKIDDVRDSNLHALEKVLKVKAIELGLIDENNFREEKVENIEIEAVTHKDGPVMGVLQWTIQGDVKGYSIKMGFDLI
ncbi:hypothetical protein OAK75_01570 [Bacteriovoracales bacterium]|nr:hypothetical protein [Bacteriovoracales bacterium]